MFEDIQKHRQAVRENIEKSFQIGYTENEVLKSQSKIDGVFNGKNVQVKSSLISFNVYISKDCI